MGANSHTNYALRKNGQQEITPIHPELEEPLEEILGPTYGLIVYQEQVMATAQKLAGYSLGQADLLRRAMGKKKKEILDKEFVPFQDGHAASNGYSDEAIKALWDVLVPFSDYAFNKAHTAAYGLVSYWTAYLKANYPAEYMAALLTSRRRRQGQVGGLPGRVPPDGHQGAAARRQRVRRPTSPRSATTSASAWPRSATSAPTWSTSIIAVPQGEGRRTPTSPTSCARSTRWSATSGPSSR